MAKGHFLVVSVSLIISCLVSTAIGNTTHPYSVNFDLHNMASFDENTASAKYTNVAQNIWASAFGPFLGVLVAFFLNYVYAHLQNNKRRVKILKYIKTEISIAELDLNKMIKDGSFSTLRDGVWASILQSGALEILSPSEVNILTLIYKSIDRYNQVVNRVEKMIDRLDNEIDPINIPNEYFLCQIKPHPTARKHKKSHLKNQIQVRQMIYSKAPKISGSKLYPLLNTLSKQDWMNDDPFFSLYFKSPRYMNKIEEASLLRLVNETYIKEPKSSNYPKYKADIP